MKNTKQIILNLLGLDYINGRYICKQASVDPIKWQNVKRGHVLDFSQEEIDRLLKVFGGIDVEIGRFLKYSSLSILSELVRSESIILRPLIHKCSHAEYDRIQRWKRGEADLHDSELNILKGVFAKFQKELQQIKI